ncbi:TonB family protein [Allopusillimonas ginsengisoli]|uniref:TonB family protein n=1 Tax=Allopusillimonas ginsengisoli TaxID=453575 RepID=UPI00101FBACE|nr:TonB family protein [Allopusillimonas ginsengisoli]TEA79094.1 TonB family protein [Allopusillimonas ginsengisoli]
MPTFATLPGARAPRNDYLAIALVLSLAIHGLLLAWRFANPSLPAAPPARALEVTLVNARSEEAPVSPRILAQQSLDGGGTVQHKAYAASPLPRTAAQSPDEIVLAALRRRQEALEAEQQRLYTQLLAEAKTLPARKQPDLFEQSSDPGTDNRQQESLILNARISAIKERIDRYNEQPRRQFAGPSAQRADYAEYVETWRKKIEILGTEHYPQEARGKLYDSLQLTVYIRRDGTLDHTEINRPSRYPVLNQAALRIVQLAAPFPPLPPAITRETDILAITRTWHFVNQQLNTAAP